jgi:chorismate-pyruvate lyase
MMNEFNSTGMPPPPPGSEHRGTIVVQRPHTVVGSASVQLKTQIENLSDRILRADSATKALERWCAEHAIGSGKITAKPLKAQAPLPFEADSFDALGDGSVTSMTKFRHVQLMTDGIFLVDALNWYFPDRLTPRMRHLLTTTEIPFGRAVEQLKPIRRTFFMERHLFHSTCSCVKCSNDIAFEHRAIVYKQDGEALAIVHERFLMSLFRRG